MSAQFNFDGKRVLVTGAGKGHGRLLSKKLYECGATVIALSRTQSDLDSLKREHPNMITVCCDLSDWDKTRTAVESVMPIHHLVNNAAITHVSTFLDVTKENLDITFATNVNAIVNVSQVVAKGLIARKESGSIVNMSSIASQMHLPLGTSYCTSKGAVSMLTKSMATELAPHNIRVNTIRPTLFMTDLARQFWSDPKLRDPFLSRHPGGTFAEERHIVDTSLFLLSDLSAMMNGSEVVVDGGLMAN